VSHHLEVSENKVVLIFASKFRDPRVKNSRCKTSIRHFSIPVGYQRVTALIRAKRVQVLTQGVRYCCPIATKSWKMSRNPIKNSLPSAPLTLPEPTASSCHLGDKQKGTAKPFRPEPTCRLPRRRRRDNGALCNSTDSQKPNAQVLWEKVSYHGEVL